MGAVSLLPRPRNRAAKLKPQIQLNGCQISTLDAIQSTLCRRAALRQLTMILLRATSLLPHPRSHAVDLARGRLRGELEELRGRVT